LIEPVFELVDATLKLPVRVEQFVDQSPQDGRVVRQIRDARRWGVRSHAPSTHRPGEKLRLPIRIGPRAA
jgi:hypothetical protein